MDGNSRKNKRKRIQNSFTLIVLVYKDQDLRSFFMGNEINFEEKGKT